MHKNLVLVNSRNNKKILIAIAYGIYEIILTNPNPINLISIFSKTLNLLIY